MNAVGSPLRPRLGLWCLAAGIVLSSFMLRPAATSVGPVLAEIRQALGMSTPAAALLTALPGLSFALAGAVASRLGHRIGAAWGLALAGAAGAVGLLARAATGSVLVLLAMSVLALCAAGLGNVLVPMAIKQRFPLSSHRWTALYVTILPMGALAPQLAAPLVIADGDSWRLSLALWGWVALASALPWVAVALGAGAVTRVPGLLLLGRRAQRGRPGPVSPQGRQEQAGVAGQAAAAVAAGSDPGDAGPQIPEPRLVDLARSPRSRALGLFFGIQSMQAYVTFAYLPQVFRDAGATMASASLLLAIFSICGVAAGPLVPVLVSRSRHLGAWVVGLVVLMAAGYTGLLLAPMTLPWLWAVLLGLAGSTFQVCLVLVTARTRDYRLTAALSGFTQSVGYALASAGPFAVGWLYGLTGGWTWPLIALIASALPMGWFGWRSCAPGMLDDELAAAGLGRRACA